MTTWQLFAPIWFADLVVLGHACNDRDCTEVARWTCYWPGQVRPKCTAHRDGWAHVADVMGFVLVSVPLPVREWPEPDPSSQRFSLMELT